MTSTTKLSTPQNDIAFRCDCCGNTESVFIGRKNGFDLYRCTNCKSSKALPFPTLEELVKFYSNYKGTTNYAAKRDKKIARSRRRIKPLLPKLRGKKFLDVGCNYGFAAAAAAGLGLDAKGIDVDESSVALAKKQFGNIAEYQKISVEDYAAMGHKADMVFTSEVIEHVLDPNSFVASIAKILNTDGVLFLTTPDGGHWSLPKDFTKWPSVMPPEHLSYFTRKGLKSMLERHGFTDIKMPFTFKPGLKLTARKA